ncbi:MAG: phospholipid carrier-dependent glycosyltransferase [Desulfobacterales bacterium]
MRKPTLALIGLFVLIYLVPLNARPLAVPDETRYGEIPREMIASGDWVVPRICGIRYFEKPVLGYWANAVSILLFGENPFGVRFPSAAAAGLSALVIFLLVRRFGGGSRREAPLAAGAQLTFVETFAVGTFSVLDGLLALWLTAAMACFLMAHTSDAGARKNGLLSLFGGFLGLAFLTKGFLAFALPVAAILPFMIWERRWRELFRIVWLPMLAAVLVSLPWALAIARREPDFWHYFFWVEHVQRFLSSTGGQHPQPFWFFVPVIVLGAIPWSFLFPAAAIGLRAAGTRHSLYRFAICWLLFPFIFFSASEGKLATYILPCFPPLAVLLAAGIDRYLDAGRRRAFNFGACILAAVTGLTAVALSANQVYGVGGIRIYGSVEVWKWVFMTAGLVFSTISLVWAAKHARAGRKMALFVIAPVFLSLAGPWSVPDRITTIKAPGSFLLSHAAMVGPDTIFVVDASVIRAVCWFYRTESVYLIGGLNEFAYGLSYDDARQRHLSTGQFIRMIDKNRGADRLILICKAKEYRRLKPHLPEPTFEKIGGGFVFIRY